MKDKDGNKLETNKEVGFLYKVCKKIKPSTISMMNLVPEFNEVIRNYRGGFTDEVVYQLISAKFREMYSNREAYNTATGVMKKISREVKGDANAWKNDHDNIELYDKPLETNTDVGFLYKICTKIKASTICMMASVPEFN